MVRASPLALAAVFAVAIAIGRACSGPAPIPPAGIDDREDDHLVGVVSGLPQSSPRGLGVVVDTMAGSVWMWTTEPVLPGDVIAMTGRLRSPHGVRNPGEPEVPVRAPLELTATRVDHLGEADSLKLRALRWAAETQGTWAARFGKDTGGAALRGIVTGDRGTVPPELDQRWRACGIYHVLSVSGLHLAVVAGLAFALLRKLLAAAPFGGRIRPERWAAPPALMLAIAYTLITGAQLATLRSLVVIAIVLIGQAIARPVRLLDAIGLAAIVLLAWHPTDVVDPSFQLSFTAALALALRPKLNRIFEGRATRWLREGIVTSAWVTLATAPLTAYHFHQVQVGGVIGNLILTPALELIALPVGLAGAIVNSPLLIHVASWIVARVDDLAGVIARVMPVGDIAIASLPAMIVLVVLALILLSRARRTRVDIALGVAFLATWLLARTPPAPHELRVTFLDVGQGDGAIVELPDGHAWIIDAGGLASRHDLAAASSTGKIVTRALEAYGHDRIELAIISHPHPDHYLGLAAITLPIDQVWSAAGDASEKPSRLPSFFQLAPHAVHPPLGLARTEAGVELYVYAPEMAGREQIDPVRSTNDNSLVIELRYAGRSILFAGDVELEGEDAVRTEPPSGRPRQGPAPRQPDLVDAGLHRGNPPGLCRDLVRDREQFRVPLAGCGRPLAGCRCRGLAHRSRWRGHGPNHARWSACCRPIPHVMMEAVATPDKDAIDEAVTRGSDLLKSGKLEEAQKAFRAALLLDGENSRVLALLGLAHFRGNQFDQARAIYEDLVERMPTDASHRLNLGLVYLKLGDGAKAINSLEASRALDPSQGRAVSYLGLAYARAGRYAEAYRSFLLAGQTDLASEIESNLTDAEREGIHQQLARTGMDVKARTSSQEIRIAPRTSAPDLAHPVARTTTPRTIPPPPPQPEADGAPTSVNDAPTARTTGDAIPVLDPNTTRRMTESLQFVLPKSAAPVPVAEGQSALSAAVDHATPSNAAIALPRARAEARPPVPLSQLATEDLVRPDDSEEPFEITPAGALVIRVTDRVLTRLDGVHATGGDLTYEPARRRSRGHLTDEKFDHGGSQLAVVNGTGYLIAVPDGKREFAAVMLDDDIFYLREDLIFAFESKLRWENGNVPGLRGRLPVVQFRGDGAVALRTERTLVRVKLPPQGIVFVDASKLAGWIGRVIPRAVVPPQGGPMGDVCVECTGEGVVLVDPVGAAIPPVVIDKPVEQTAPSRPTPPPAPSREHSMQLDLDEVEPGRDEI
ncbi:MAG: ComEC/Rec2 family competence protein [Kofleriaceae bacterium]